RSPDELTAEFSEYFDVIDAYEADHITPGGVVQRFAWYLGRRK
ncbi:MAG: SAM-dependent methyltransferase, partial [Actinobacteria bacterium]|nr:SAM-dependent methyltransferase [Actinomycetota bacterium]